MREETEYKPKPMVEVGGELGLWHIVKIYAYYGFRCFILCASVTRERSSSIIFLNYEAMSNDFILHHRQENRLTYQSNPTGQDFGVTLVYTGFKTMAGGRVKRIERFIDSDTFLVTFGDSLVNANIGALVRREFELRPTIGLLEIVQRPIDCFRCVVNE